MIPVLATALVLLGAQQQVLPADSLVLTADEAFVRALESAPALQASRNRTYAAGSLLQQAGAWSNPVLSVTAENLGATQPTTGIPGMRGVEGQAVLGGWVPIGGDRGALRAGAEARLLEARSMEVRTEADLRSALVEAIAWAARDDERLRRAREEATGLESLAVALAAQAESGRASEGEAARAHLAMVSAHTTAAEVAAEAAASRERLTLMLGLPPATAVRVRLPSCTAPSAPPKTSQPPEVAVAQARTQAAAAAVSQLRAGRIPDLAPQVGVRRSAGVSALYLGFSIGLPLFDRSASSIAAAASEQAAMQAELDRVERQAASERASAQQGLIVLEEVGTRYTEAWASALDLSVRSAEARYRLGEGTLTELLDGRRARLQALDGYETWRADLFTQRARVARLSGTPIDATTLCGAALPTDTSMPEERP